MFGYCQAVIDNEGMRYVWWGGRRCSRLARRTVGGKVLCEQHAKIEESRGGVLVAMPQ